MTQQTITGPDGERVEIDADLFKASKERAFEFLKEEAEQKGNFKDEVDTIAEVTGLTKGFVSKYFKTSYKAETEKAKLLGDAFASLDEATDD